MRTLRLTSPYLKGADVKELQTALNHRAAARGLGAIAVDGEYGPDTHSLAHTVAWLLGIGSKPLGDKVSPYVQTLVIHPKRRNSIQRARSRKRIKEFEAGGPERTLAWCRDQVGTIESPPNSNRGPLVSKWERDFHMDGQPWCGAFVGYALRHVAGVQVPDGTVYTPNIIGYGRSATGGFSGYYSWSKRQPGDLILFRWGGSSAPCDHVGILDSDGNHTIEGNTSSGNSGSQNNGGGVYRRDRQGANVVGCARPRYR